MDPFLHYLLTASKSCGTELTVLMPLHSPQDLGKVHGVWDLRFTSCRVWDLSLQASGSSLLTPEPYPPSSPRPRRNMRLARRLARSPGPY